jgi:hypothetical protein
MATLAEWAAAQWVGISDVSYYDDNYRSDAWKDGYDAWKLASPDDEFPEEECRHEEFEINWEGRATCDRCGEHWWASQDEIAEQRERIREYDRWCIRQERREFLRRLTAPIRWPIYRLLERIWPRKSCAVLTDDEIPF